MLNLDVEEGYLENGKTDEEKFGFTYKDLDCYIRGGKIDSKLKKKIDEMYIKGAHKEKPMPTFSPDIVY